jgi:hypothetical protein
VTLIKGSKSAGRPHLRLPERDLAGPHLRRVPRIGSIGRVSHASVIRWTALRVRGNADYALGRTVPRRRPTRRVHPDRGTRERDPEGDRGASLIPSAAVSHPLIGTSDRPLPGPAHLTLRATPKTREPNPADASQPTVDNAEELDGRKFDLTSVVKGRVPYDLDRVDNGRSAPRCRRDSWCQRDSG